MLAKCVLTVLELNGNQRFRGKKTQLSICHTDMLTLSKQLQKLLRLVSIPQSGLGREVPGNEIKSLEYN